LSLYFWSRFVTDQPGSANKDIAETVWVLCCLPKERENLASLGRGFLRQLPSLCYGRKQAPLEDGGFEEAAGSDVLAEGM